MADQSEKSIFRRLNGYVKERDGEIFHTDVLYPGFPDKTILLPGARIFFPELKRPGGRMRPGQAYWQKRLRELGFQVGKFDDYQLLIEWIEHGHQEKTS